MTDDALKRWQEKQQYLERELAIATNAAQKYELQPPKTMPDADALASCGEAVIPYLEMQSHPGQ